MVKIRFPKPKPYLTPNQLEQIINGADHSELAQDLRKEWTTNGAYSEVNKGIYGFYLGHLKSIKEINAIEDLQEYARSHPNNISYKNKTA